MSHRRVLAVTRRLLQQFRRDRRTLGLVFVVPLVILGLLYYLVGGSGERPRVAVVDLDRDVVATAVASQLGRSTLVDARPASAADAHHDLEHGDIAAVVTIPQGFSARAASSHVIALDVAVEGTQPSVTQQVVQAVSQALASGLGSLPIPGGAPQVRTTVTYRYGGGGFTVLDYMGPALIGVIVFFLVFVITIVAFLRERTLGTLERLMASPLRRFEIALGYMLGLGLLALLQSAEVLAFCLGVLHIRNSGSVLLIFGIELLMALTAVNLAIFLSMFARTEFQAVQFIPIAIVPQFLLSGIIFPVSSEPGWLQAVSRVLPLTYAVSAMQNVMIRGAGVGTPEVQLDVGVVAAFCIAFVVLAAATLRRRVA